jgi:hypothetical protein
MSVLANLSRVLSSDQILPSIDQSIADEPNSHLMLMVSADLRWRRKEWQAAIDAATSALIKKPNDFHALSILVTSYGHLQNLDAAYPFAKRLILASPPPWKAMKVVVALLTILHLFTVSGRVRFRRGMHRCDQEAQADRDALSWAHALIAAQTAGNESVVG